MKSTKKAWTAGSPAPLYQRVSGLNLHNSDLASLDFIPFVINLKSHSITTTGVLTILNKYYLYLFANVLDRSNEDKKSSP